MQYITKLKLAAVHQLCDAEDKSTEYTLQLMQDTCKLDLDTCLNYLKLDQDQHSKLFKEINDFTELMIKIDNIV
jgi:hypothetical protein